MAVGECNAGTNENDSLKVSRFSLEVIIEK